jgi:hypothetical protein
MPIANIIGLAIIGALVLTGLVIGIRLKAWAAGYKQGWEDADKLTKSVVYDILNRAGEMEEMNNDRVDAAPESGSEEN